MRVSLWPIGFLVFFVACGGSGNIPVGGPGTDTVNQSDSSNTLPPTFSPPVGPTLTCDDILDQTPGHAYPFQGLIANGKTFTCTACPSGFNKLNGQWLWFAFDESGNVILDLKGAGFDTRSDELTFNGNTFVEIITGVDSGSGSNKEVSQRIEGYFVCPPPEEMPSFQYLWVITKAEPEGSFGNKTGDIYPYAQLDSTAGVNDMMLWFDYDWSGIPPPMFQAKYCRRGQVFEGVVCEIP